MQPQIEIPAQVPLPGSFPGRRRHPAFDSIVVDTFGSSPVVFALKGNQIYGWGNKSTSLDIIINNTRFPSEVLKKLAESKVDSLYSTDKAIVAKTDDGELTALGRKKDHLIDNIKNVADIVPSTSAFAGMTETRQLFSIRGSTGGAKFIKPSKIH